MSFSNTYTYYSMCQMAHSPMISELHNRLFEGPKFIYGVP